MTHSDRSPAPDQPLNREQRRAARFRPNAGNPDPHAMLPPQDQAAGLGGNDDGSFAGGQGDDVTHDTGPGPVERRSRRGA